MMRSSSSDVAGGAPSSPPAHHFEIGDEEDEHDEHQMMTSNGNHGNGSGEQPFEDDIEDGGGDNDAPSPYQVFRTPVNVDYAESSVVAPCDLPEGHNLRVDLGRGRILVVQVPFGGVKKGDTFSAPYRIYDKPDEGNREYMPSVDSPRNRTVGVWRASLCGCCEFGWHPTSLGAFICQCCKLPSTDRHCFIVSFLLLLIGSQQATSASFHSHFVTSVDPNASELLGAKVTSVHISQNLRWGISRVCNILLFQRSHTLLLGDERRRNKCRGSRE